MKPVETGVAGLPQDGMRFLNSTKRLNAELLDITIDTICPIRFELAAAPAVAKGKGKIEFDLIDSAFERLSSACDILLIEGAGGAMTPLDEEFFMLDLAGRFNASTLLVSGGAIGMISDLFTYNSLLQTHDVSHTWCVNERESDDFRRLSLPYLEKKFDEVLMLKEDGAKIAQRLIS